jgi:diguanylate cyclase (GGDEF)-like protein
MAYGLAKYYRYALPSYLLFLSFMLSLLLRAAIWNGPRNTIPYELYYQLPFMASLLICAFIMSRVTPQRFLDSLLGFAFIMTSLLFLVKPFMAVVLGSGATATEYVNSRYAVFSQSMTAVLLIAIALALLLVVVRDTLEAARREADTDELSGLFNRRAFNREAAAALLRAGEHGQTCVVLVFDLDHFKTINDTHGHSAGDLVIREFSSLLKSAAGQGLVAGRTGGEEFSVLMPDRGASEGLEWAEHVLAKLRARVFRDQDREYRTTVSCGAAVAYSGESLEAALRRSDAALYAAKQRGRDRVAAANPRDVEIRA